MPSLSTTEDIRLARIAARTCSAKPYRKTALAANFSSADSASNFIHVDENTLKLPTATHSFPPPAHPLGPSSFPRSSRHNTRCDSVDASLAPSHASISRGLIAPGGIPPAVQSIPLATHNSRSIPADVPGYLTYEQYKQVEERWIAGLNPRKRGRCLIDQQTFDTIWDVLEDPENQNISNAQTRWWIRKMFTFSYPQTTLARSSPSIPTSNLSANPHALDPIVVHDKKPLAIKEHMYQILCSCHAMCGHGGRDRTCAVIREHWAWIPKELVALFVRNCPTCLVKKTGNPDFGVLVESQKRQAENKEKEAIESVVAVLGAAVVKDGLVLEGAESAVVQVQTQAQTQAPLVASNFNNSVSGYVVGPDTDAVADLDCTAASSSASGPQFSSQSYLPYPAFSSRTGSPQLCLPGRYDDYHPHYFGNPGGFAGDSFQSNAVPPKTIFDSPEPNMFMFLNNDAFSPALGSPLPPPAGTSALDSSTVNPSAQSIQRSHPMSLQCLLNSPMDAVPNPTSAAPPSPGAKATPPQVKPFGRGSLSEKRGIVLPPVVPTAINAVLGFNGLTTVLPVLQDQGGRGTHPDVRGETDAENGGTEAGTRVGSMERGGEDVTMGVEAHESCKEIVGENESTQMILLYPGSSFERRFSGQPQYEHTTPSNARQHNLTAFDCPPVSPIHLGNVKHVTRRNFDLDVDYAQASSSDGGTSPERDSGARGIGMGALMFDSSSSDSVPYSFEGQAQLRDEMSFEPGGDRGGYEDKASSSWAHHDWLESLDIGTRDRFPLMLDEATPKINGHGNGSWLYEVDLAGTSSSSGSDPFLASMKGGVGISGDEMDVGFTGCAYGEVNTGWDGFDDLGGCADAV